MVDRGPTDQNPVDRLVEVLSRKFDAVEHRHGPVAELAKARAQELGLKTPRVLLVDSPISNAACVPVEPPILLISKTETELFRVARGTAFDATLVHEFSHAKDGIKFMLGARMLPFIAPVVTVVAWHLISSQKNKKHMSAEELKKDDIFFAHNGLGISQKDVQQSPFWKEVKSLSQDVAAAAAGAGLGMIGTRQLLLRAEYRADKLAAELVSPDAMKEALAVPKLCNRQVIDGMSETEKKADPFLREIGAADKSVWERYYNAYITHAHPATEQRIARLDAMKHEKAAKETASLFPETRIAIHDIGVNERMVLDLVTQAMKIKV